MWQQHSSMVVYGAGPLPLPVLYEQSSSYVSSKPKLLEQVRRALRVKHYALRTEETYINWIKRFILYHDKRHPQDMDTPEIEQFLTWLAVETTMIYTHVIKRGGLAVRSPLDE